MVALLRTRWPILSKKSARRKSSRMNLSTRSTLVRRYNLKPNSFSKKKYRYIVDPDLAQRVTQKLGNLKDDLIIQASPGPGIWSEALLNAGAARVLGLEPDRRFHPALKEVQSKFGTSRFTFHRADFAKIDPHLSLRGIGEGLCIPPAISSSELFKGVKPIPWESESLVARFVGIESGPNSSALPKVLLGHLARIASRDGVFGWGRCELAFFYTQQRAEKVLAKRGSKYFNRLSILVSLFCDVKTLHSEPCLMFDPHLQKEKEQDLHLISLVPKKDPGLRVTRDELMCVNHFVRLLMVKQSRSLASVLDGISPGSHVILHQLNWPRDTCIADLQTEEIGKLISTFFQWDGKSLEFFYSATWYWWVWCLNKLAQSNCIGVIKDRMMHSNWGHKDCGVRC